MFFRSDGKWLASTSTVLRSARFSYFFFLSLLNEAVNDFTLRRNLEADFTVLELLIEANDMSKNPDCLLVFMEQIEVLSSSLIGEDVEAMNSPAGSVGLTLSGLTGSTTISPVVLDTESFFCPFKYSGPIFKLEGVFYF